jgi:fructokinase
MDVDARRVLVIGEALVDIVSGPDARVLETRPGGAPLNVAVGLARLDVPTVLLTTFGGDEHGDLVRQHLSESGVPLASQSRDDGPTSVAHASLDGSGAATYRFDLRWDPPRVDLPTDLLAVHVGSLGTVLAPGAETTRRLVADAAAAGATVTYDPNVRPVISTDHEQAWSQVREWAALAHVVKLSDADAEYLRPDAGIDATIDALLGAGRTRLVVVTQGAAGSTLATRAHRVHVDSPEVDVVDTVGAGDSFMSALVAVMADRELHDPDALRTATRERLAEIGGWAATAAAVTCSRRGADPPRTHELPELPRG